MNNVTNKASSADDGLDLSGARSSHGLNGKGLQPLENGKSCLPSPVGAQNAIQSVLVDKSTVATGANNTTSGSETSSLKRWKTFNGINGNVKGDGTCRKAKNINGPNLPKGKKGPKNSVVVKSVQHDVGSNKGQKPSGRGKGSPKDGQARHISTELNTYKFSKLYHDAIAKGFKSKAALDAFNTWTQSHIDDIDEKEQVACHYCGQVDLLLCDCFISESAGAIEVVDDAIIIPSGRNVINIQYSMFGRFWRRVMRGYNKSTFEFDAVNNHHINEIPELLNVPEVQHKVDDNIIEGLYNFIRVNQHTSYELSGVDNRQARLAHSHKLALRWVTLNKLDKRLSETMFVNQMMITVQRATDQAESSALYTHVDPNIKKPGLLRKIKKWAIHGEKHTTP